MAAKSAGPSSSEDTSGSESSARVAVPLLLALSALHPLHDTIASWRPQGTGAVLVHSTHQAIETLSNFILTPFASDRSTAGSMRGSGKVGLLPRLGNKLVQWALG